MWFIFWNFQIVFQIEYIIFHSHQECLRVPLALRGVWWQLTGVLIWISLVTSDVGHLCLCSVAICLSFREKYLFKSTAHFWIGFFGFCWVAGCLYILGSTVFLQKNVCFFVYYWLCQVLVVPWGIDLLSSLQLVESFVAARRIFSCDLHALSCSMWELDPWPGIEPRPLHWKHGVLASRPPGKSQQS